MNRPKVIIPYSHSLNKDMLAEAFEIVTNPSEAEFAICWKRRLDKFPLDKTILCQSEPPICWGMHREYKDFDNFFLVVTFNPKGKNQIPFAENSSVFPYVPSLRLRTFRKNTTISNRKLYFAGRKDLTEYPHTEDFGSRTIYKLRSEIAGYFGKKGHFIFGIGFKRNSKRLELNWHDQKFVDFRELNPDFVLAMENSMFENYISEKIWDGLLSDRVTLYLGCPNVHKFIPKKCFVDLRQFLDEKTMKFDFRSLEEFLNNMTQEEYDKYVNNARDFIDTILMSGDIERSVTTKLIIERIKCKK